MKFHFLIAAALLVLAPGSQAALIHQYDLNGSLADKKGTLALVALGGVLGPTGYAFGDNKGLELKHALGGTYSIDMSFRFDEFYGYNRIIDFKNNTTDNGFYAEGDMFRLYPDGQKKGDMTAKEYVRLTVTRGDDKVFKVYQAGSLVLSVDDRAGNADFGGNYAYFFRDDTRDNGRHEAPPGAVDFINIYSHALSPDEVKTLATAQELPEPASLFLLGAGLGLLGWTRRHKQRAVK